MADDSDNDGLLITTAAGVYDLRNYSSYYQYATDNNITLSNISNDECQNADIILETFSNSFYKYPPYLRVLAIALYSSVSCFGACGNLLVMAAVARNPQMRIPRHFFIINLALADFLMCTITVPFTASMALNTFWNLGWFTCKFVSMAHAINVFVSTMSITAIGMDRYWVIIFPTKIAQQRLVILICFVLVWTISIGFALPLFYATELDTNFYCGKKLNTCVEKWSSDRMPFRQTVYTLGCMIFQYLLPLVMLTFLYSRIIGRLKNRLTFHNRQTTQYDNGRRRSVEIRQRRMNSLLICIVLIFAVSWLPLNIFNALIAFETPYNVAAYAFCHIVGMTSACANPVLYGVLNENFRAEFGTILAFWKLDVVYRALLRFCRCATGADGRSGRRAGGDFCDSLSLNRNRCRRLSLRRNIQEDRPTCSNGVLLATNDFNNSRAPTPSLVECSSTVSQHSNIHDKSNNDVTTGASHILAEETTPLYRNYLSVQDAYVKHCYPKSVVI